MSRVDNRINNCSAYQEGLFFALSGVPFLVTTWFYSWPELKTNFHLLVLPVIASLLFLVTAFYARRKSFYSKLSFYFGTIVLVYMFIDNIREEPMQVLLATAFVIFLIYSFHDQDRIAASLNDSRNDRILYRLQIGSYSILPFLFVTIIFFNKATTIIPIGVALCMLSPAILGIMWVSQHIHHRKSLLYILMSSLMLVGYFFFLDVNHLWIMLLFPVINILILSSGTRIGHETSSLFEPLVNHPARLLVSTFLGLIVVGTFLLVLPISASDGKSISLIDATFTSVSAVCVTGLIVLDTPSDFSFIGQIFILALIQAGGLGIMTIASIALHAMGKRFSLRQERILAAMSGDELDNLIGSFRRIAYFTLICEGAGAIVLSYLFYVKEQNIADAIWRGIFTSISAFCNAGFALQSDSLVSYQESPFILHIIALLIILGGLSPATCLIVPDMLKRKRINLTTKIVLVTTLFLLICGTVFIGIFEWDTTLKHLGFWDKIHNAWFQSATLRTAGFNSIDISSVSPPTFIIMLFMMFVGGSPGGTAGGIKTTTFTVSILCIYSIIRGHNEIIIDKQKLDYENVYKAIAVTGIVLLTIIISIIGLELTQLIEPKDVAFEVFSAMGTVGLSTGATIKLDEIGKFIIMTIMFLGRIGPLTMFMVLSSPMIVQRNHYPTAKIPIT